MKWEMMSHTSEAKFRAYGTTDEERFANAALAMFDIMFEVDKVQPKVMKKVLVKGRDLKSLLHNWLEELLLFLDSELFILQSVKKIKLSKLKEVYAVDATILGETATDATPRRGAAVKAVTYDEMELTPEFVQVVVDV
ncbi:MAG: archease [Nanoarchaeota archaeon]